MKRRLLWGWVAALLVGSARGEIVIDSTRVIFPMERREVTLKLKNEAPDPRLVQVWIDEGDPQVQAEYSDVPFTISPPILRMEAGKSAALRVAYQAAQGLGVPTDKESVYWLNVLGIRPNPAQAGEQASSLQFAFRTRIKLFLRPVDLLGQARDAPAQLQWRRGEGTVVQVHNPGSYHVTLSSVVVSLGGVEYRNEDPPMIAPGASATLPLDGLPDTWPPNVKLRFSTLDDYGNTQQHEATL